MISDTLANSSHTIELVSAEGIVGDATVDDNGSDTGEPSHQTSVNLTDQIH